MRLRLLVVALLAQTYVIYLSTDRRTCADFGLSIRFQRNSEKKWKEEIETAVFPFSWCIKSFTFVVVTRGWLSLLNQRRKGKHFRATRIDRSNWLCMQKIRFRFFIFRIEKSTTARNSSNINSIRNVHISLCPFPQQFFLFFAADAVVLPRSRLFLEITILYVLCKEHEWKCCSWQGMAQRRDVYECSVEV